MLIGLVSDTHIAWPHQGLPKELLKALAGVDLILHAGDIWIPWVLDELEAIAPVLAAQGDDDLEEDVGEDARVSKKLNLTYEGLNILVTHIKPRYALINPAAAFSYETMFSRQNTPKEPVIPPDIVVYGHSHYAAIENYKGTVIINPGSPTLPEYLSKLGTVGLMTLKAGQVETRIVQLA